MKNKKILIFIDWFYPGFKGGGPIQSCLNLVLSICSDFDVSVVTRNSDYGETEGYKGINADQWVIYPQGYRVIYLSAGSVSYAGISRIIEENHPDHIYINSMFSRYFSLYPLLNNVLRNASVRPLVTIAPRGMLLHSAVQKKKFKKKLFFRLSSFLYRPGNIRFHATNEKEDESVKKYFPGKIVFVANNLPSQRQDDFVSLPKQPGTIKLIFISRIDPIKNLDLLLDILSNVKAKVSLEIAGPFEDLIYWEKCKEKISTLPGQIDVKISGPIAQDNLSSHLKSSHLYVLLTKGENFGHTIFEAFLAGRPVLISDQTPWKNLRKLNIGAEIAINDYKAVENYIEDSAAWNQEQFDAMALNSWLYAKDYLARDINKAKYLEIFNGE